MKGEPLAKRGALTVCGEKVDLGRNKAPFFVYGSREDHIVPWMAAYRSVPLVKGSGRAGNEVKFVLGASGHIAGVVNPPAARKRSHWTNDALPPSAAHWFETATEHPGSWWPDWAAWLEPHGGRQIRCPQRYGKGRYRVIEPAPGRYVKAKA